MSNDSLELFLEKDFSEAADGHAKFLLRSGSDVPMSVFQLNFAHEGAIAVETIETFFNSVPEQFRDLGIRVKVKKHKIFKSQVSWLLGILGLFLKVSNAENRRWARRAHPELSMEGFRHTKLTEVLQAALHLKGPKRIREKDMNQVNYGMKLVLFVIPGYAEVALISRAATLVPRTAVDRKW